MKASLKPVLLAIGPVLVAALAVLAFFVVGGVSARPAPGRVEAFVARTVRNMALAWHTDTIPNPVPPSADVIAQGRAHFADHCASCHANNGSGEVEMGRGLSPRAPDMRLPATQRLSDAQLFYIIENGIRLTGMPGWSTGTAAGETDSWHLVHFIRHLPQITPEEVEQMDALNPKSPEQIRQDIEAERFLRGEDPAPRAESPQPSEAEGHAHE
jgi:mono/diheme cytochrome c family protein